jgi:hypothetical protein
VGKEVKVFWGVFYTQRSSNATIEDGHERSASRACVFLSVIHLLRIKIGSVRCEDRKQGFSARQRLSYPGLVRITVARGTTRHPSTDLLLIDYVELCKDTGV